MTTDPVAPGPHPMFPVARPDPSTPPPSYAPGGDRTPHRVSLAYGGEAWLVVGYDDARRVLADTSFSSDATRPDYPNFPLAPRRRIPGHFIAADPPEHGRVRRIMAAGFSGRAILRLAPSMAAHAAALVDGIARDAAPFDLIAALAVPLHGAVVAESLGVPPDAFEPFRANAARLLDHRATPSVRAVGASRLDQQLRAILAAQPPGEETLLARLAGCVRRGDLTADEAAGAANLVVAAGLETTVALLGLTVLALLRSRGGWAAVSADPAGGSGPAVQEALRYWTVVEHGVARVATADTTVSGVRIAAGEAVVVHLATANRDPGVYPQPDEYHPARPTPAGHLAFGHGPHRCLGAALAQAEVAVAVAELARRLPDLALDPSAPPVAYLDHMLVYGVPELRLDPRTS
ncbi:cytochrome P450 [Micromonospora sp. NPDC092111]|uniref:cytochrome P450 n=1 Tax=Micromonospora sp. NPDC092111 TaxID=3364289 RepID=UPI0037F194AD